MKVSNIIISAVQIVIFKDINKDYLSLRIEGGAGTFLRDKADSEKMGNSYCDSLKLLS